MANSSIEPHGLTFSQKPNVIVDNKPTYYAIQKNEWDYLKALITKCDTPRNWIEILTSTVLSIGVSFIISLYTTEAPPVWFGYIGYSFFGLGIFGIVVCMVMRKVTKSQTTQIQEYFNHIESHLPSNSN